jgi:hypothetical protein
VLPLVHERPQLRRQCWLACRGRYALGDLSLGAYAELGRVLALA